MTPTDDDSPPTVLATLFEADRQISRVAGEGLYALCETLHQASVRLAPAECFYVALYLEADSALYFPYNVEGDEFCKPVTLPLGHGPTSWAVRNQRAFVLEPDTETVQRAGQTFGDMRRTTQSALHLPMRAGTPDGQTRVLGVLSSQSYRPHVYDASAQSALQWLADRAGMALLRAEEETAWQARLDAAEARTNEHKWQAREVVSHQFLPLIRHLYGKALAVSALVPPDQPALEAAVRDLVRTCRRVQAEAGYLPLRSALKSELAPSPTTDDPLSILSDQDREILRLLADGRSNAEIAERLYITLNTTKDHLKRLYRKLGVRSRAQAAQRFHAADQ